VDRSSAPTDDEISGAIDSLELEVRRAEAAIEIAIK
jgi:hypothetical protein